ncbi:MAG: glycoside hydrolase, partial [Chloroflexota bacterium]|nr:glycoside hydrolase [Chloroflexota bacterium]
GKRALHPVLLAAVTLTLLLAGALPATGVAHHDREPAALPAPTGVGSLTAPSVETPMAVTPLSVDGDPIVTLVPAPAGATAVYVVGQEGLYRTTDGGESWEPAGPPPPSGRLVAAQDSPLVLLAGSRPPCARGGGPDVTLSRSDDGGTTWQPLSGEIGVEPLAIWREAELALAADCAGLRISRDTGRTWADLPVLPPGSEVTAFAPRATGDVAQPAALLATTSEGGTSRLFHLDLADPANPALSDPLIEYWGLGSLPGDEDRYVLGAATGVWLSDDRGATWTRHRDGLEAVTISVDPLVAAEPIPDEELQRGFGIDAVAANPASPDHLYAGTIDGLFASRDAGPTWEQVEGVEGRVTTLVLVPQGGGLFAQTPAGVVVVPLQP